MVLHVSSYSRRVCVPIKAGNYLLLLPNRPAASSDLRVDCWLLPLSLRHRLVRAPAGVPCPPLALFTYSLELLLVCPRIWSEGRRHSALAVILRARSVVRFRRPLGLVATFIWEQTPAQSMGIGGRGGHCGDTVG